MRCSGSWRRVRRHAATDAELSTALNKATILLDAKGLWVGWEASFSALSGQPLPIDPYYVPQDLAEWGQVSRRASGTKRTGIL